jgi:hypothetical protein
MIGAAAVQAEPAPSMKMTTDIPPGIAIPDKVDTRLGTLNFFDGFPDKATVAKVYDSLDFQRAVQAYLLALAPVNMAGLREGLLGVGPANVTIPTFEVNMNARSIFLTADATTPYTWIWIEGPGRQVPAAAAGVRRCSARGLHGGACPDVRVHPRLAQHAGAGRHPARVRRPRERERRLQGS